ncbi:MAG: site-specific integrase [Dysgonomonas sp.]|nr:site-specific integrase [Dysgonomonas sp.]
MFNSSVTITIICRKDKKNQQNQAPLYLRLMHNKQRKLIYLKEKINVDFWDFEANQIKPEYPNKEYLEIAVNGKKQEIEKKVLTLKLSNKEFTLDDIIEPITSKKKTIPTVKKQFEAYIQELFEQDRIKNAKYYRCCLNCLMAFTNEKDLEFTQIDTSFLTDYSNWMKKKKLHKNTIGNRLRGLKAIYNQAIAHKYINKDYYPFDDFKVNKFRVETSKRAITKTEIQKIIKLDLTKISTYRNHKYYDFARDIFLFSYFSCGINIVDISYLKYENIIDGNRLCFYRRKTNKLFSFKMHPKAMDIILKYRNIVYNSNDYVFPILSIQETEKDKYNRINGILKTINKYLQKIGEHLKIETTLTTYVARHTYATVLKRSGVNTSIISESLGHSSEKVTQIYLDSFENSQIDEAMKNLL